MQLSSGEKQVSPRKMSAHHQRHKHKSAQTNLVSLFFCTLAIVSICLSAFNLYLFAWIWSKMGAARGASGSVPPMEFIDSSDVLKFNGRLTSAKGVSVQELRGQSSRLTLSASGGVEFKATNETLLNVGPRKLAFPAGLRVRSPLAEEEAAPNAIECSHGDDPRMRPSCQLNVPHLKLSNQREKIDFATNSLQVPKVSARRLHSQLNKLQLMSSNHLELRSTSGRIGAQALETVRLVVGHLAGRPFTSIANVSVRRVAESIRWSAPSVRAH